MAQKDILVWLVNQRRARPQAAFTNSEVAVGSGMSPSNSHKAINQLVRFGEVEEIVINCKNKSVYRVSDKCFEKVTGLLVKEVTV
jgi:hypothetical protein